MTKIPVEETFFVVVSRDGGPQKWVSAIGKRQAIDYVFKWMVYNFGQDECKWFSILSHEEDATVLDIHIFEEELYKQFFKKFEERYLPEEEENGG